jgi:Na+/H+ antiporter NhaD/arsenite permease-like protein
MVPAVGCGSPMTSALDLASFPAWTIVPFGVYLLLIALLPLLHAAFWEHNRNKLLVAGLVSLPVLVFLLAVHPGGGVLLGHAVLEYLGFMALLAALFVVSGGIYIRGSFAGTPIVNTGFLAIGVLLASLIGTTGASVLLIRPLLRANAARERVRHIVVFFILTVSNAGGLLTPLGDPPLYLGFLRGVPFAWTLQLLPVWAVVNGTLLVLFNLLDQYMLNKEEREREGAQLEDVQKVSEKLRIDGGLNLLWLACVPALIAMMGTYGAVWFPSPNTRGAVQILALLAIAALSYVTTTRDVHRENEFAWGPIVEVAVVFVGIFVTMIPALGYLEDRGGALGVTAPWQFFWATGALSSFLDNAPTYLTFTSLAVAVINQETGSQLLSTELGPLAAHPLGGQLLAAISCGAVLMGAVTYIGNGPNFMVKAIAERARVEMPGFFGYMLWSVAILMPTFVLVTILFF